MLRQFYLALLIFVSCFFNAIYALDRDDVLLSFYQGDHANTLKGLSSLRDSQQYKLLLSAQLAYQQEKWDEAARLFSQIQDPEWVNFMSLIVFRQSVAEGDAKRVKLALQQSDSQFKSPLMHQALLLEWADIELKKGNKKQALARYEEVLAYNAKTKFAAQALRQLVILSAEDKDRQNTVKYFKKLLLSFPHHARKDNLFNKVKESQNEKELEISDLFLDPHSKVTLFRKFYESNQYDLAIQQGVILLKKELVPQDDLPEIRTHLGMSYFLQSQYLQAIEQFRYVINEYPDSTYLPKARFYLARAYQRSKNYQKAVDIYDRVINLYKSQKDKPFVAESYYYQYLALKELDPNTNFQDRFSKFKRLFPKNKYMDKLVLLFAWEGFKQGQFQHSFHLLKNHAWETESYDFQSKQLFWLGKLIEPLDKAKAKSFYNLCLDQFPFSFYAYRVVQDKKTDQDEKEIALKFKASGLNPDSQSLLFYTLGFGSVAQDMLEDQIYSAKKDKMQKIYTLALLYSKMGNYYDSIRLLTQHNINLKPKNGVVSKEMAELLYPRPFWNSIQKYANQFNVDPFLMVALIREESRFNPQALSKVGAIGLSQVMPGTGKYIAKSLNIPWTGEKLLANAETNIMFGTYYVSRLKIEFNNNYVQMLMGYNAGPNMSRKWSKEFGTEDLDMLVANIPYSETQGYVIKVLKSYWIYKLLYS